MNLLLEAQAVTDGASNAVNDLATVNTPTSIGGWISLGLVAFALLTILVSVFYGIKRGFGKTVIRIVTIAAAAGIAYFVAMGITDFIDTFVAGKTLEELITTYYADYETAVKPEIREIIASFDVETAQLIVDVVIAIVTAPVVFIAAFYVIKAVLFIVYWLLGAIVAGGRHKGLISRLLGAALGVVQGVLVAAVVLLPVCGFLTLAGEARDELTSREDLSPETVEAVDGFYTAYLDDAISSPVVTLIGEYGYETVFKGLTHATVEGEEYDMREKAVLLAGVVVDAMELKGMDWKAPNPDQQTDIERILHSMAGDEYMAKILAGVLRGSSTALTVNIDAFPVEEPFRSIFVEAFGIFADSDHTNVEGDLATMLHVYFIMADNEILVLLSEDDTEALKGKLTVTDENGTLIIDSVIDELHKNERTDRLVAILTKLSISIMADQLGLGEDINVMYENVKGGINDALAIDKENYATDEEYREALNESVSGTLEENGILLEDEIVEGISDYIADNYSDLDEVTDQEINDVILSYYSSYVEYKQNNPDADIDIPDVNPDDLGGLVNPDATEGA